MSSELLKQQHIWVNRLQTSLLVLFLIGISSLTGSLLFGELGFWLACGSALFALLFEPMTAWRLTLKLYRARPIYPAEAPTLWRTIQVLADRAELPSTPVLYYVPSTVINAFAIGNRKHSAIALTDGLLSQLSQRELVGVLGHEIAHVANGDLKVMGLADYISRLTNLFSGAGQLMFLITLPVMFVEGYGIEFNPLALLILIFSPHLAILAQLGLSRVREYDADLKSALLTGDPMGLAYALARIERVSGSWLAILLPGWGNPEPSWLRSHPATEERIKRLEEYAQSYPYQQVLSEIELPPNYVFKVSRHAPRWRIGGLWR
jgi:heat shock protein HtpX